MKTPEDQTWEAILDAALPNAADMAAAEAELAELDGAPPLAPAVVQAVVQRTTAVAAHGGHDQAGAPIIPLHRSRRQFWLLAAVLLFAVSGLAWVVLERVWPHESSPRHTLPFWNAVRLATEPGRTETARFRAIGEIDERCGAAALVLRSLENSDDRDVANAARRARLDLASQLSSGVTTLQVWGDEDYDALIIEVSRQELSIAQRVQILQDLKRITATGLNALLLAGRFFTGDSRANYSIVLEKLLRDLTQ